MLDTPKPQDCSNFIAHKFGGSSLANAERLRDVARILSTRADARQIVVVSAMQGVTDALIQLIHAAANRDPAWRSALEALRTRHQDLGGSTGVEFLLNRISDPSLLDLEQSERQAIFLALAEEDMLRASA